MKNLAFITYSEGTFIVSRLVLSNAGEDFTLITSAAHTFCPLRPRAIPLIHFVKVVLRNFPAIVHNKPLDFIAHSFLAGGAEVDFHPIGRVSDFLHNIGLFCFLYGQRGSVCGGAGFIAHRLSFP